MAPKGLKPSKKDKKPIDWVEGGVQGASLILSLVTSAAEVAPVPYLKQAAGTALKIINTVQSVKENKANFQRLADDVAQFIAGIWESYQEIPNDEKADWPPHDLRNVIGDLVSTLDSILQFVEEQIGRNKAVRVLYSMADAGKIQEYRERLAAAVSQFEMRSHLNLNHALNQLLKHQRAMQAQLNASPTAQAHHNAIEIMAKVEVNTHLLESTKSATEERERLREADRQELHRMRRLEEERIAEERARELLRLREMENARIAEEQAKELQRLRDAEKARLAEKEEQELRRLRELEKAHKDRLAAQEAFERLRLKEDAIRAAEEDEKERRRLQMVEIERRAAEERESERQRRDAEKARADAEERIRRREEERIREEKEVQRKLKEERDRFAAELEAKKQKIPPRKPTKASGKMKARVEEVDEDDETDSESEESEDDSDDPEAMIKAALLAAKEAQRATNKTKKKKANTTPLPAENPPNRASVPPMSHPPFHPVYPAYGAPSPYGSPYAPYPSSPPPMGMYTGYYAQASLYPVAPGATIHNVNSGNISNVSISNVNNNNSGRTRARGKKTATQ